MGCLLLQSLLGDGVIVSTGDFRTFKFPILTLRFLKIWRLYIIYGKRAWVIAPAIVLVLAYSGAILSSLVVIMLLISYPCTAVGSVAFQFIVHAHLGTDIFHVATSWITAYFALTMCTNVLCSGNRIPL